MKITVKNYNFETDIIEPKEIKFDFDDNYVIRFHSYFSKIDNKLNLIIILENSNDEISYSLVETKLSNSEKELKSFLTLLFSQFVEELGRLFETKKIINLNEQLNKLYKELMFGERMIDFYGEDIERKIQEKIVLNEDEF